MFIDKSPVDSPVEYFFPILLVLSLFYDDALIILMLFFFILFLFYHEYLVVYKFLAFCFQFFLKLLQTLPKKCPYSEFSDLYFPTFGLNTDQKNFKYGHFLCSETYINFTKMTISFHFISFLVTVSRGIFRTVLNIY